METGTLEEIGAKLGDTVKLVSCFEMYRDDIGCDYIVGQTSVFPKGEVDGCGESFDLSNPHGWRLVSRAKPTGPVRTVTRKEIVPGTYGKVKVDLYDDGSPLLRLDFPKSIAEIRAAIATLTEIADALEGGL